MDKTTNTLNWFEILALDIERSKRSYENIFEIEMETQNINGNKMVFFPWEPGSGKANGSLVQSSNHHPSAEGTLIFLNANPKLDPVLDRVKAAGGTVLMSKMIIGEHGNIAYIMDTEGNQIGIHSIE